MKLDNIRRATYVIRVLAKHGLVLTKYGFAWYLPFYKRGIKELPPDLPKKIRESMEELGGTYIKLGQLLSIRPDLIPQEYCDEFAKLLDDVPPEDITSVETTIAQEFGRQANKVFSHIDPKPLGSASVAQVHKARLNGKAVAVKVQRPDVASKFKADIDIIRYIGQKLQKHLNSNLNIPQIIDEFETYTKKELNFTIEASHIDEIRKNSKVIIPNVFWTHTTEKILTMEYLDGEKLSETKKTDKPQIARQLVDAFLDQIFKIGAFHADLHPGNILLMKNGKIGLLDFGIVGHLDEKTKELGLNLYLAILEKDTNKISEVLLKYGEPSSNTKIREFVEEVRDLFLKWWENSPEERRITRLMHELFLLCYKNHVQLPKDTILLGKGMITVESTARRLDPKFDFVTYSQPKIAQLLKQQKKPAKMLNRFAQQSKMFAKAISELPNKAIETLDAIKQGRIELQLDDNKFRHLGKDINLSSNRLSYALIAASLIMAGATLINMGPKIGGYGIISLLCLAGATVFITALFISITREGNPKYDRHIPK